MRRIRLAVIFLIATTSYAQPGAPASPYYNGFDFNQTGTALKNALSAKVITTHVNELTYQEAENAIKIVDLDPFDASDDNVLLVYGFSSSMCPSSSADDNDHRRRNKESDGGGTLCKWNREHTYPKSLGNPDLGEAGPGADAHHLRACDVERNSSRSNKKYGQGSGDSQDIAGAAWYPGDEWKGDVARMMMYMYIRYGNQCRPKNVGFGTIVPSDSNMIDLFLEWNAEDPVSLVEDQRNTYLGNAGNSYGQGNRNPFIDNPYLATLIWGGTPAENRWPNLAVAQNASIDFAIAPNPANGYFQVEIAEPSSVRAYTMAGQLVLQSQPNTSHRLFLPAGMYFVKVENDSGFATRLLISQ